MPYKDKTTAKEYAKKYREAHKNKAKEYQKEYSLKHSEALKEYKTSWYKSKRYDRYGISKQEFDTALENQMYSCAICSTPFSDRVKVYIDHCHTTGKVRGLLCFHCNTGLGHFKDNVESLRKAEKYLNDNPFSYT